MSTEMILRLVMLGSIAVVLVVVIAMEQDSYSRRVREDRPRVTEDEKIGPDSKPRHRMEPDSPRPTAMNRRLHFNGSDR